MDMGFDLNNLEPLVARVLHIEDRTFGSEKDHYLARYRGRLLDGDSETAYDRLADSLKRHDITPLFRWEEERHAVFLVKGRPAPRASNPWVNFWLGIATIISVGFIGYSNSATGPLPSGILPAIWAVIPSAAPYALSLLAILAAHEFGHYLVARYHGVHVTLPYFIPMPFSPFGTMGAVINMKEQPKNRKVLLDIGLAGPFAGLLVAIPLLLIGLSLSQREPAAPRPFAGRRCVPDGRQLPAVFVRQVPALRAASASAGQLSRGGSDTLLAALLLYRAALSLRRRRRDAPPRGLGGLGGSAGDHAQPDPGGAVGRRSRPIRSGRTQRRAARVPLHHRLPGDHGLRLAQLVAVGRVGLPPWSLLR